MRKRFLHRLRRLLILVAVAGCPKPVPPPVPPTPPDGAATCATACERMRELHCIDVEPTPEGATCDDICQNIIDSEILTWDLDCRTMATSCDEVENCEVANP